MSCYGEVVVEYLRVWIFFETQVNSSVFDKRRQMLVVNNVCLFVFLVFDALSAQIGDIVTQRYEVYHVGPGDNTNI